MPEVRVMDYDTWIALFAMALVELRPHVTAKIAQQHAIAAYDVADSSPKCAARAYLFAHGGTLPPVKPAT